MGSTKKNRRGEKYRVVEIWCSDKRHKGDVVGPRSLLSALIPLENLSAPPQYVTVH